MNPNVGRIVNGNAVLDRATFARVVEPALRASAVNSAPLAAYGQAIFANAQETDSKDFTNLYTSGRAAFTIPGLDFSPYVHTYQDSEGQWSGTVDQAGVAAYMDQVLANPNTLFILDSEEPGSNYHNRRRTLYFRKNDVVLPVSTKSYYESSTWVDNRAGVIFVFGVVFSLVGAPVLSAELSSIAAGEGVTATAAAGAAATNTTVATTLVSNAGQVLGDSRAGLVNQAIKLGSLASGDVSVDTLADSQGDTGMFEDLFSDDSSPYDGWNFSSGESDVAWSDAQNVDFGMGIIDGSGFDPNSITGFDFDPLAVDPDSDVLAYNSTPEVTTNDFGTTFDGPVGDGASGGSDWGGEATHVLMGAAPIAASAAKGAVNSNPSASGSSTGAAGNKASAIAAGSNDVLATIKNLYNVGAAAVGGAVTQAQTAVPRTYSGQLGASGGSTVNLPGMSLNTIAVIGGVLIVAALVLHLNSKG